VKTLAADLYCTISHAFFIAAATVGTVGAVNDEYKVFPNVSDDTTKKR
jgi:hypothetical protein